MQEFMDGFAEVKEV
jgi:hypothetical protein